MCHMSLPVQVSIDLKGGGGGVQRKFGGKAHSMTTSLNLSRSEMTCGTRAQYPVKESGDLVENNFLYFLFLRQYFTNGFDTKGP
jgi:hypothetical protein